MALTMLCWVGAVVFTQHISATSIGGLKVIVLETTLLQQAIPAEFLQCFNCRNLVASCISLVNITTDSVTQCALNQPHCMVRRIEMNGNLKFLERACVETCYPGCMRLGRNITCTSCCNSSRCNTDNTARHVSASFFLLTLCISLSIVPSP